MVLDVGGRVLDVAVCSANTCLKVEPKNTSRAVGPQVVPRDATRLCEVLAVHAFCPRLRVDCEWESCGRIDVAKDNIC